MPEKNKSKIDLLRTELGQSITDKTALQRALQEAEAVNQKLLESLSQTERARDGALEHVQELAGRLREQEIQIDAERVQADRLRMRVTSLEAAKEAAEIAYERTLNIIVNRLAK
jgi:phage gp46-like protein